MRSHWTSPAIGGGWGEGLSTAGQRTQRGVAVQAAVRFRRHGGVTACVGGLGGHGRDVVDRGGRGRGGAGLRGAVDHCCTCAARNTRQRIGFIEITHECHRWLAC